MKKYKKIIIGILIAIVVACGIGFFLYTKLVDENALSINEKKWIDQNSYKLVSINVPNDITIFGTEGTGVFFDYLDYLKKDVGLNVNSTTISYNSTGTDYHFEVTSIYDNNALLMFKDHYVLVSKNAGIVTDSNIPSLVPGVLNSNMQQVTTYYHVKNDSFKGYNTFNEIVNDLNNGVITYALVPLNEFKELLVKNNINIASHISDLNKYYYFKLGKNDMLNSIYTKTFNTWMKEKYEDSYNTHNYDMFIKNLGISDSDEDTLTNKVYRYGFTENRPYEIISSGSYGGITAEYLNLFSDFSGVV